MVSGWTVLAAAVWLSAGIVVGLLIAAILVGAQGDGEDGDDE